MTLNYLPQHLERFLFTLTVVSKEAVFLAETRKRSLLLCRVGKVCLPPHYKSSVCSHAEYISTKIKFNILNILFNSLTV